MGWQYVEALGAADTGGVYMIQLHRQFLLHRTYCDVKVTQSCLTLCDPMDYIVCGILQARILERGSCSLLQEIFPNQGLNPGLPQSRQILYQLSHQWSPIDLIMHMQKRPVGILRGCSFWYRCGDGEEQPQLEDTKPTQILLPFFPTKLGRVTKNDVPPVLK